MIPYKGKVVFEPLKEGSIIANDKDSLVEAGTVITVGEGVDFLKEGDTVFFLSYGAEKTPEVDGKSYWTLRVCDEFVMGRIDGPNHV